MASNNHNGFSAVSLQLMPQMKKSGLYRLAMLCAIIVVILNTWLASRELKSLFAAQAWRAHTLEVITHTTALELAVGRADSAVRGYLLVGSPRFEERYRQSVQNVDSEVAQIRRLTDDNVSQQQRLDYLRGRIMVKFSALDAGIAIRNGGGGSLNERLLEPTLSDSPDGGPTVAYTIAQVEGEEQRLLNQRNSETAHAQTAVWASFIGASLLDILLILTAFEFLIRITRDRYALAARSTEIATLNSELQTLNADLEDRVEQRTRELAVSNQELEAFSYSVSHDLRAPLRTIDGFSLALLEDFSDKLNEEGRDYIGRVRNGVQRMGTLIDALLQLSRVTRTEVQRERVDLSQLATLVFNELHAANPERDVLFVALPGVLAEADPRLVRIALENLIGNAYKFTSRTEGGRIEFGSEPGRDQHAGQTVYFIRDNGAGFDMHYVDRLFTAFQRLHGDRDFKGSGIGLATVSRIIRRHHGTVWAESELGHGATFYFTLAP
jgi:signal transduction histidine kinase